MPNHFDTLGVNRKSSDDQIRNAYKALAKKYHPDINKDPAAEVRFKEINAAYDTLKDKNKRMQYEAELDMASSGIHFGGMHTINPESFVFRKTMDDIFGNGIFDQMFRQQQRAMNVDINVNYYITLEEAFHGKATKMSYTPGNLPKQEIEVTIPAGTDHGDRLVYRGRGVNSDARQPPGNLIVNIGIRPHATFKKEANNLITTVSIDPITAIVGGTVQVKTIDEKLIEMKIPKLYSGEFLAISGYGMPVKNSNTRGDLFVIVEIKMPKHLPDKAMDLLVKAKKIIEE